MSLRLAEIAATTALWRRRYLAESKRSDAGPLYEVALVIPDPFGEQAGLLIKKGKRLAVGVVLNRSQALTMRVLLQHPMEWLPQAAVAQLRNELIERNMEAASVELRRRALEKYGITLRGERGEDPPCYIEDNQLCAFGRGEAVVRREGDTGYQCQTLAGFCAKRLTVPRVIAQVAARPPRSGSAASAGTMIAQVEYVGDVATPGLIGNHLREIRKLIDANADCSSGDGTGEMTECRHGRRGGMCSWCLVDTKRGDGGYFLSATVSPSVCLGRGESLLGYFRRNLRGSG